MNAIFSSAILGLFLAAPMAAQELSAGMPMDKAVKVLRVIAIDRTSGMAISTGANGQPDKELCWELKHFNLVLWLNGGYDGKVASINFWTKEDFNQPVLLRDKAEKTVKSLTLDPKTTTFTIEKFSNYLPDDSVGAREQSIYAPLLYAMREPVLTTKVKDQDYVAFRILYLPGYHSQRCPAVLRYEKNGDHFFRHSFVLSHSAPDMTTEAKVVKLSPQEGARITASLETAGIWKMPKVDSLDAVSMLPGQAIAASKDGSRLIIEAIKHDQHRVCIRWNPRYETERRGLSALVQLCTEQFHTAGIWKEDESK